MSSHRVEFRKSENPWAPTAVIEQINSRTGAGLELVGLAEQTGGTSSAAYVRWPDGRDSVISRGDTHIEQMRKTAEVLSFLRDRGVAVPRHELVVGLEDGFIAVVQERLPGEPLHHVDSVAIDALVECNEAFAGLLQDQPDVPSLRFNLRQECEVSEYWHGPLYRYSDQTRGLVEQMCDIGNAQPKRMVGDDLVHVDYNVGNILFADNRVTGVVDWNAGVVRGDRRYALVGLSMLLTLEGDQHGTTNDAVNRLDKALISMTDPSLLRCYWASAILRFTHKAIQKRFSNDRIDAVLDLAERHLYQ